jgi:threonine aldolase
MTAEPRVIDLRSDTVTLPSPEMRRAMADAPLGDDVYGEDPTVNRLQEMAAAVTGKEAALFVPSGTMGNLLGVMLSVQRGDEVLVGSEAHVLHYELIGATALTGALMRPVPQDQRARMQPDDVEALIRREGAYSPRTALLCLENTNNRCSGAAVQLSDFDALCDLAHRRGLRVHIDGARIFNAALALETTPARIARDAESVTFCFSQGLGAPVGSVFCASRDDITRARKLRRILGGGMRQAGVLAAAAIYALEHMVDRLADDHANAKVLARGLAQLPQIELDPSTVDTNIVIFGVRGDWQSFARSLNAAGVLISIMAPGRLRMVAHYGIERGDIDDALARIQHTTAALA